MGRMNISIEDMLRQTIEMLFEEDITDPLVLDPYFQAIIDFSDHFDDISYTDVVNMITETAERKNFENGIIAAQFMNLLRQLRKGPWMYLEKPAADSWAII